MYTACPDEVSGWVTTYRGAECPNSTTGAVDSSSSTPAAKSGMVKLKVGLGGAAVAVAAAVMMAL
jgi:hypothetical protein